MNTTRQFFASITQSAPLFPVAIGMIGGIILDRSYSGNLWLYALALVGISAVFAIRKARTAAGPLLLLIAAMFVGAALHGQAMASASTSGLALSAGNARQLIRVCGVVASQPRLLDPPPQPFTRWTYARERTVFQLDAKAVGTCEQASAGRDASTRVSGRVRVSVAEAVLDLREGETIEVFGWLYPLRSPSNPGAFDWATFSRRQGVVASIYCDHRENVRRMTGSDTTTRARHSHEQADRGGSLITRLRSKARALLTDDLVDGAEDEASLLEAMILGHRSRLDRRINELYIRAGCIHFLAVSGIHVVIVMFFVRMICLTLFASPRTTAWVMLLSIVFYVLLAEPRPPILRAGVLASLYCISLLLGRERSYLNWISASAIALLVLDPAMLFDIGFQLSFVAVLGVSYLTPSIFSSVTTFRKWLRRVRYGEDIAPNASNGSAIEAGSHRGLALLTRSILGKMRRYAPQAITVALGAWLAALPIIAVYFHRIQPLGAVNSCLVFPLVGIVMGLGFAKVAVGAVFPWAGPFVGDWLTTTSSALTWIVNKLGALPGSDLTVPAPPWWVVASYYTFLASFVWWSHARNPREYPVLLDTDLESGGRPHRSGATCLSALVLSIATCLVWLGASRSSGELRMTVLAVGSGSATVIELPGGRTILYDVGTSRPMDVGRNTVVPFLRSRGIRRIDRVYLSHANLDHYSGLPSVVEAFDTGPIIVNEYFNARSRARTPSRHLLKLLNERPCLMETLRSDAPTWELDGVRFEVLSPTGTPDDSLGTNDTSTVMRLSYKNHSILLTGDIEERTQRALLQRGDIEADVLVLPHHGSIRASSPAFIRAVGAGVNIRSSSQRLADTFNGLQAAVGAATLYNTADVGAVTVVIDSDGLRIDTMR